MPLPGGPADKLGNRYELWWTVWQLVRMLDGKADSIRIEDPGVTKAEFVISHGGRRELDQAKRSHPGGKWSLASLAAPDMRFLQAIYAQLTGNDDRFVFVSSSDARELADLAERSQQPESLQEFEEKFLVLVVDQFELFVQQMASEGVLAFEQGPYTSGHESFFDYGGPPRIHRAPWAGPHRVDRTPGDRGGGASVAGQGRRPRRQNGLLTNASVAKPLQPFEDYDDRSLIENCCIKAAKPQWDLGHPPQKTDRAVRVHVLFTRLLFALAMAYRRPCAREAKGGEPVGWQRWRRQLLEQTRNQVIVFAQGDYGIFHIAEYSRLLGVKLKDVPPAIGSRQQVLAKYRLPAHG